MQYMFCQYELHSPLMYQNLCCSIFPQIALAIGVLTSSWGVRVCKTYVTPIFSIEIPDVDLLPHQKKNESTRSQHTTAPTVALLAPAFGFRKKWLRDYVLQYVDPKYAVSPPAPPTHSPEAPDYQINLRDMPYFA